MNMDTILSKQRIEVNKRHLAIFILAIAIMAVAVVTYFYIPDTAQDWNASYKPATLMLLQGNSPYTRWGIFVPPWTFAALAPFAVLPAQLGRALLFTVSLAAFVLVSICLKAKPIALVAILFSYPVLFSLMYGNLEWLIALGFILPPQFGLFFVLIKPNLGIPIAIFWLFEAWRDGRLKEVIRVFAPVTLAFLASFAVFGFWPLLALNSGVMDMPYNSSLWPQSIPIGVILLVAAIRSRRLGLAMIAAPFLSPYVAPQSWSLAVLGLAGLPLEVVIASLGIWGIRAMTGQFLH